MEEYEYISMDDSAQITESLNNTFGNRMYTYIKTNIINPILNNSLYATKFSNKHPSPIN